MARGRGFDDAAGAVNFARGVMVFAIGGDARCVPMQHFAVMPGADRYTILPHIAGRAVPHRPPRNDARSVVPRRALDQLDVMRFLRRGLLGHVDRTAAEHRAARGRCHQLHHCRANRHSPSSSIPAGGIAQRVLPMPFNVPCNWQKRRRDYGGQPR